MLKKANFQSSSGCLSDKDVQLIRKTYAKLTQIYYQNPQGQSVADIINLGHLIVQTVKTKRQADALSLVSIVQTLKVKSKSRLEVLAHIDQTVAHLKNPTENKIKQKTLMHCLQRSDLFVVGCTVAIRFYQKIHTNSSEFNFKDIIGEISRNIAMSPALSIELLFQICKENELNCRYAVKSGLIKFVFLSYITQTLDNKFNLYKAIKLIKVVSNAQNTLLRQKQKPLALVIFTYEDYVAVIEGIIAKCYDADYSNAMCNNKLDFNVLDQLYLWSYLQIFAAKHLNQAIISQLVKMLNSNLDHAVETKVYGILANFSKFRKVVLKEAVVILPKSERALLNYIKLCVNGCEIDSSSAVLINMAKLQALVDKSPNPKTSQLFKYLRQIGNKEQKIGILSQNIKKMFDMQKNADFMMQRASKIPQNNDQLTDIRQILKEKDRTNQFQSDTLRALKERALQSLHTAVIQKKKLDLNPILKDIDSGDIRLLSRLLQILQLHLVINPDLVNTIESSRVVQIIQWIQDNYKGQMIEWASISELLMILFNQNEWKSHLNELNSRSFWLLSIQNLSKDNRNLLYKKLSQIIPPGSVKIPLIVGFLSKCLEPSEKVQFNKTFNSYFTSMIDNIKNNSSFSYKINLLMFASFLKDWYVEQLNADDKASNQFFKHFVKSILEYVLNNFRSLEQQYELLQNCLPITFGCESMGDNLDYLVCLYGRLAAQIYKLNNQKGNKLSISYDRIKAITKVSYQKNKSVLQILNFLQYNSHILQSDQLTTLLDNLYRKKGVYWHLYPNFYNITSKIIKIISITQNSVIINSISNLLYKLLTFIHKSEDVTKEQCGQLTQQIKSCLETLLGRNVPVDKQIVRKGVQHIKDKSLQTEIEAILNQFKLFDKKNDAGTLPTSQGTISSQIQNSISSIINSNIPYPNDQNKLDPPKQIEKQNSNDNIEVNLNHLDDNSTAGDQNQLQVLQALRLLRKIINNQEPVETYTKLNAVFIKNHINTEHTDILGHLLALFYPIKHPNMREDIISLLLNKEKTRLSRQGCYSLMNKFSETFCLSKRWKLIGKQWLDLAMLRFSEGFYADASQVAQHNLPRTADVQYFFSKKYHEAVVNHFAKVEKAEDFTQLLVLVGTSARHQQIKNIYYKQKLHLKIIQSVSKHPQTPKFIANLSYALSSLVYMQPQVCIDLVKQKQQMQLLINSFKTKIQNKSIIQSGACLIANLSYSNQQVKQALRQLNVVEIFLFLFQSTLDNPQISTFKQILRAFGNLSLSLKCTQEIIDQHFCGLAARMAEKIDIFVNFDDKKAGLMKIMIDLIANLASHRYKLQNFHKEKVTQLIITLLQTTQNNLPILTACIDTIDCLCQNSQIQNYVVVQRKIPNVLIDILKIQTDQKIVVKSTRLLTNLTINTACIPHILEANLLNVLANIVMPHFYGNKMAAEQNKKMQTYVLKVLTRIFASKPEKYVILKSGYLDCLIRTIETTQNIEDSYIEILYQYSQIMPSFLNKRAFICLIKVLTRKMQVKDVAVKCLITIKKLSSFYERDEEDLFVPGTTQMYQKILTSQMREEGLLLLCYHLLRSNKLRQQLCTKLSKVLQIVKKCSQQSKYLDVCKQIQFLVHNPNFVLQSAEELSHQTEYDELKKGFRCNLYRIDGSSKKAILDMNQECQLRAYKFPDGEIKKKYIVNIKNIKDFQFNFPLSEELWNSTIFAMEKGIFDTKKCNPKNCATIVGYSRWGEISYINVEFESELQKNRCCKCICTIYSSLR